MTLSDKGRLQETLEKCEALANDRSTTSHEREAARAKAEELRAKLDERYHSWVKQGKALLEEQANVNWKLGELASQVDKEYGKDRLKQFADDLRVKKQFLVNCRTTFIAWPEKTARPVFSIAERLNAHPQRFDILAKNPNITKAEASEKMREYRDAAKQSHGAASASRPRSEQTTPKTTKATKAEEEKMISVVELVEKLTPIIKKLKEKGLKPAAVAIEAGKLETLLNEWRTKGQ